MKCKNTETYLTCDDLILNVCRLEFFHGAELCGSWRMELEWEELDEGRRSLRGREGVREWERVWEKRAE